MTASWKTSLFGAGGLVVVAVAAASALLDGKPETNPDWPAVMAAAAACIGLLFARDNKVTSAQAGATDTPKP